MEIDESINPCFGCGDYNPFLETCASNGACGGVLTPAQFAACMRQVREYGPEMGHIEADGLIVDLLRALGYGEGADIFDDMPKWYS